MNVEHAAVEIGNCAKQFFQFRRPLFPAQAFVEQFDEEIAIEGIELVEAMLLTHEIQPRAKIVAVVIQKSLVLDKIDKHQAVEHDRGIPFGVALDRDAVGEGLEERRVFFLELVVEFFGDALDIEGLLDTFISLARCKVAQRIKFRDVHAQGVELADEQVARLPFDVAMRAAERFARLAFHPIQEALGACLVREYEDIFRRNLRDRRMNGGAVIRFGSRAIGRGDFKNRNAGQFGDGRAVEANATFGFGVSGREGVRRIIPTEFVE